MMLTDLSKKWLLIFFFIYPVVVDAMEQMVEAMEIAQLMGMTLEQMLDDTELPDEENTHPLMRAIRSHNTNQLASLLNSTEYFNTYLENNPDKKNLPIVEAFKARNRRSMNLVCEAYGHYDKGPVILSVPEWQAILSHPTPPELLEQFLELIGFDHGFENIPYDIIARAIIEKSPHAQTLINMEHRLRFLYRDNKTNKYHRHFPYMHDDFEPIDVLNKALTLDTKYIQQTSGDIFKSTLLEHAGKDNNLESIYQLILSGAHIHPFIISSPTLDIFLSLLTHVHGYTVPHHWRGLQAILRKRFLLYWAYTTLNTQRRYDFCGTPITRFQFNKATQSFINIDYQPCTHPLSSEEVIEESETAITKVILTSDIADMQHDLTKKKLRMLTTIRHRELGIRNSSLRSWKEFTQKLTPTSDTPELDGLSSIRQ